MHCILAMSIIKLPNLSNIHQSDRIITLFLHLDNLCTIYQLDLEKLQIFDLFKLFAIYEPQYTIVADPIEPDHQLFLILFVTNDDKLMISVQKLS